MHAKAALNATMIKVRDLIDDRAACVKSMSRKSDDEVAEALLAAADADGRLALGEAKAILRNFRSDKLSSMENRGLEAILQAWTFRAKQQNAGIEETGSLQGNRP